jgi:hypothetical protein
MSEAKCDQLGNVVLGTVFRNAYIGDIEKYENVPITLDQWGVHGTANINGWKEQMTRLNEWDYSFDAPDSVCPLAARQRYVDAAAWRALEGIVSNDEKPELWVFQGDSTA